MFDPTKHKITLINLLKDIYSDVELRTILGFKGGTAAMMFYNLPRLSVDLDFDLLNEDKKELVLKKIKKIIQPYGKINDASEKRFTLFFLLSYEKGKQMAKIEISKRKSLTSYEFKSYLGVPMLVVKKEDAVAGKLAALITRKKFAMRDVFDIWHFLKNDWSINEVVLKEKTNLSLEQSLKKALLKVGKIQRNQVLQGLGELLDKKQKAWVKENLISDTIFHLKLLLDNL